MKRTYGRKTVFSLVIVAAALAGCSASSAGTGDTSTATAAQETTRVAAVAPNAKSGRVRMIADVLSTVALTDDQRTAIETLASDADARHAAEAKAHKDILLTLAGQVEAGAIDRAALQPKIDAATAAMSTNHPADQAALQKLHALLTPEQRGKVADALESRHKGMVHEHEHGPGGHHDHLAKLADDLKLTDAQKAQVAAAFAAKHAEHAADFKAMHEAHEAGGSGHGQHFAESFRSETLTFPAPPAGHEGHAGAAKMADHFIGMAEVILPILTPEQRTLAAAKLRERAAAGEGAPLPE